MRRKYETLKWKTHPAHTAINEKFWLKANTQQKRATERNKVEGHGKKFCRKNNIDITPNTLIRGINISDVTKIKD